MSALLLGTAFLALATAMAPSFSSSVVLQPPESNNKLGLTYSLDMPYTEYLASWRSDGKGDNVAFQAYWEESNPFAVSPSWYFYEVWIGNQRQNGESGSRNYEASCPNEKNPVAPSGLILGQKRVPLQQCQFKLAGDATGILKTVLVVRYCYNPFTQKDPNCGERFVAAADYARVESGATMMQLTGQQHVYQEGDVVKLQVRTGSCGAAANTPGFTGCYSLSVHDSSGKTLCASTKDGRRYELRLQECDTTISVPAHAGETRFGLTSYAYYDIVIPKGAFIPRDVRDNQWRVELLNEIVSAKTIAFFTVDSLDKIPPTPTVTLTPSPLVVGTSAHLTITAQSNPAGALDLRRVRVYAWYGVGTSQPGLGSDDWILDGKNVTLDRTDAPQGAAEGVRYFTAQTTFVIPKSGNVQVMVVAVDTEGRASEPGRVSGLTVGAPPAQEDLPSSTSHRTLVAAVLLIAAAAAVAVHAIIRNPMHKWLATIGVSVAALAFVGWVYWTAGGPA